MHTVCPKSAHRRQSSALYDLCEGYLHTVFCNIRLTRSCNSQLRIRQLSDSRLSGISAVSGNSMAILSSVSGRHQTRDRPPLARIRQLSDSRLSGISPVPSHRQASARESSDPCPAIIRPPSAQCQGGIRIFALGNMFFRIVIC